MSFARSKRPSDSPTKGNRSLVGNCCSFGRAGGGACRELMDVSVALPGVFGCYIVCLFECRVSGLCVVLQSALCEVKVSLGFSSHCSRLKRRVYHLWDVVHSSQAKRPRAISRLVFVATTCACAVEQLSAKEPAGESSAFAKKHRSMVACRPTRHFKEDAVEASHICPIGKGVLLEAVIVDSDVCQHTFCSKYVFHRRM